MREKVKVDLLRRQQFEQDALKIVISLLEGAIPPDQLIKSVSWSIDKYSSVVAFFSHLASTFTQ